MFTFLVLNITCYLVGNEEALVITGSVIHLKKTQVNGKRREPPGMAQPPPARSGLLLAEGSCELLLSSLSSAGQERLASRNPHLLL